MSLFLIPRRLRLCMIRDGFCPIAAAAAKCAHPVSQALVSMTQTFIDTIIVCSLTGFCIMVTGIYNTPVNPADMTAQAFNTVFAGNIGSMVVAVSLGLFVFLTIVGWYYYGERSIEYLFGVRIILPYKMLWCVMVLVGALAKIKILWDFSDFFNGMMIIPNLIALILLSNIVVSETNDYFKS
ncbi:MAG: alanine:cation symporter family protein [bacterium]